MLDKYINVWPRLCHFYFSNTWYRKNQNRLVLLGKSFLFLNASKDQFLKIPHWESGYKGANHPSERKSPDDQQGVKSPRFPTVLHTMVCHWTELTYSHNPAGYGKLQYGKYLPISCVGDRQGKASKITQLMQIEWEFRRRAEAPFIIPALFKQELKAVVSLFSEI